MHFIAILSLFSGGRGFLGVGGGGCLFEVGSIKSTFGGWGWALINFFSVQGGRLFEVGAFSRLGA